MGQQRAQLGQLQAGGLDLHNVTYLRKPPVTCFLGHAHKLVETRMDTLSHQA